MKLFKRTYDHGHGHGAGNDPDHIETSHLYDHTEYRDLNFKAVVQFMIALFATVAFSYISMFGMMKVFQWEHEDSQVPLSPVADTAFHSVGPGIQVAPYVDLTTFRWHEDSVLSPKENVPGLIPIEQAIKEVAAEGLPYRSTATADQNADTQAIPPTGAPAMPDTAAANAGSAAHGERH